MKVVIDHERCTGHGRCFTLAPDVFASDDVGFGTVTEEDVEAGSPLAAQAGAAVANCPESAIRVEP